MDEAALAAALRGGRLGGAAFDVFEPEPLPAGNVWADCPNVLLTPHIAGVTTESNDPRVELDRRRSRQGAALTWQTHETLSDRR